MLVTETNWSVSKSNKLSEFWGKNYLSKLSPLNLKDHYTVHTFKDF